METQEKQMEKIQKQLIGKIKRCFLNTEDCYTVSTEYFHYRNDFYNYISVEENETSQYSLIMGLWLDNLKSFLSKTNADNLNGDEILNVVREISSDFH